MAVLIDDGFYDARIAREIARGERAAAGNIVLAEISQVKGEIDVAVGTRALTITISDTVMTTTAVYYEAWSDPATYQDDPHNLARLRMNRVVNYFTRLGYTIKRRRHGRRNLFDWIISW